MRSHYHIPMQLIMKIESKLSNTKEMEHLAKNFIRKEEDSMAVTLKELGDQIVNYLDITDKTEETLREYLVEKNIPIEINFKPLRVEQLVNIVQEWLSFHTENSTIVEKLYTNKHRNILFKRILFDEKETISDYFNILSDRNMLKAVDLYQLLVDIFSSYFLYEYNADPQTFFEKVNSFNTFVDVVQKFIHSEKRIYLGSSKEDFNYIRRIEFERLIEFWEEENPELVLLSEKRINKVEVETQTTLVNMAEAGIQAERDCQNLKEFINSSMISLNKITLRTNECQELEIIESLYSYLRKSKIALMNGNKKPQKQEYSETYSPNNWLRVEVESSVNTEELFTPKSLGNKTVIKSDQPNRLLSLLEQKDLELQIARTISPPKKVKDALDKIYKLYKQTAGLSVQMLELCFLDIGIIDKKGDCLVDDLIKRRYINDKKNITYDEFKTIMNFLMQKDKDLTIQVLDQFVRAKHQQQLELPTNQSWKSGRDHHRKDIYTSSKSQRPRTYIGRYLNCTIPY